MCRDFYDLQELATREGWYAYATKPNRATLVCSCGEHLVGVATDADDPDYYSRHAEFVMGCQNGDGSA